MEIDDLSDTFSTYSDDEQDPAKVQVACLSNIVDLQRACQGQNLKFSSETNRFLLYLTLKKLGPYLAQKLIQKLVDRGELEWDSEEDFEVEAILDYVKEDEKDLYLIKWKGWTNEHNTWEPKEHLGCAELLEQFHANFESCSTRTELKRKLSLDDDDQPCKRRRIDDIWARISTKYQDNITPLKLLSVSQTPTKKYKGLNGLKVAQKPSAIPKLKLNRDINNKRTKAHRQLKKEIQAALKAWEKHLNDINSDPASISVENNVDLCGPPENFEYINDYKATGGVEIPMDPIVGCECDNCFEEKKQCCPHNSGADWAYYKHGKVRVPPGSPIYECNMRCNCGSDCPNRVVQHGRKHKVCVFRTNNGRGWGVKALQAVKKGSFVMEYVGEVITNEEAERRGKIYDAEGQTYLFDLDYNDGDCPFTVDAGFYGNVSHFVNHSCDPNLAVYGVWINTLDPRLPRIALFAKNDIKRGEELTFDYMMTGDTTHQLVAAEQIKEALKSAQEGQPLLMGHDPQGQPLVMEHPQGQPLVMAQPPSPLVAAEAEQPRVDEDQPVDNLQAEEESDDTSSESPREEVSPNEETEGLSESDIGDMVVTEPSDDGDAAQDSENGDTTLEAPSEEAVVPDEGESGVNPFIQEPSQASPQPIVQYRMMCQCGAANCRKYLF